MWAKNEGDIIWQTIDAAIDHVDTLMIADDGSTDNTWDIIQIAKQAFPHKIEHIQQAPDAKDKGQRTALLNEVRRRYRPEDTWVQVVEADVLLLDTDVRAIASASSDKVALSWHMLNACRRSGTWREVDTWPHWNAPIREIMPHAHWMEVLLYTFRPFEKLFYDRERWRPWPKGFSNYSSDPVKIYKKYPDSPLVLHVGHRGPTHFYEKYRGMGPTHTKYRDWKLGSPEEVEQTVAYFNGTWNDHGFEPSREGWKTWVSSRNPS